MGILVSINCITYNQDKYIAKAIEGFLIQKTDFDFEIIIGEDNSTDNTKKIIAEFVERYPNKIKLLAYDKNVGVMKNLKNVYEESSGKYIALCEGDDYWTDPLKLQKQINYLENNEDCSLCCHNANIINVKTNKIEGQFRISSENKECFTKEVILGKGGFIATQSIVVRKRVFDNMPAWYWNSSIGDYSLQLIASTYGHIYYIDEIMSVYSTNIDTSWTVLNEKEKNKKIVIETSQVILTILDNFDNYSEYIYTKYIQQIKIPIKFNIYKVKGDRNKIREYKKSKYYKELNVKIKIKMNIKALLPNTCSMLNKLRVDLNLIRYFIKKV